MPLSTLKKIIVIISLFLAASRVDAQLIKNTSLDASIGYGISVPSDEYNLTASGFYLQGEYVLELASWIDIRPYAGVIFTKSPDNKIENQPNYSVTSNAFLIGGKTRFTAPIPWIAPYFEIGAGASIGSFKTFTPSADLDKKGLIFHIPVSIGFELGRNHNFDIAFTYYFHPIVQQFSGAAAFGISFPLSNNSKK